MGLTLVTGPTLDPIAIAEVKAHSRITTSDEDGLIAGYILAARHYAETFLNRALVTQTWDLTLDYEWPWTLDADTDRHVQLIEVPKAPLQSVISITYIDESGVTQTLASDQYLVDATAFVGRITPAYDVVWPCVRDQLKAITVRFIAGYGDSPSSIPETVRQAMLLLIAHWYENREAVSTGATPTHVPLGVEALLTPHRVYF